MTDNRKTTVPGASVGADAVQSSDKITTNIITNSGKQINLQAAKKSNNFGLNTVSMTEPVSYTHLGDEGQHAGRDTDGDGAVGHHHEEGNAHHIVCLLYTSRSAPPGAQPGLSAGEVSAPGRDGSPAGGHHRCDALGPPGGGGGLDQLPRGLAGRPGGHPHLAGCGGRPHVSGQRVRCL